MGKNNSRISKLNPTKLKKIFWIVSGGVREEIFKDNPVPLSVAKWKLKQLRATSHRTGKLEIVDCDTSPIHYKTQLSLDL